MNPSLPDRFGAWGVFALFAIPFGTGIPGGVLLARRIALAWPFTALLYFVSDIMLAFVFEGIIRGARALARRSAALERFAVAWGASIRKMAGVGDRPLGPFAFVMISFGVDPMSARVLNAAAGYGFVAGWAMSIAGDMLYYAMIAAATLWLDSKLNDSLKTAALMTAAMIVVPMVLQRRRKAPTA